jgi:hypothetical protein
LRFKISALNKGPFRLQLPNWKQNPLFSPETRQPAEFEQSASQGEKPQVLFKKCEAKFLI